MNPLRMGRRLPGARLIRVSASSWPDSAGNIGFSLNCEGLGAIASRPSACAAAEQSHES
jgi:hypothetical protein